MTAFLAFDRSQLISDWSMAVQLRPGTLPSKGGGGCNPKKTEKTSPKFEICGSVRFFSVFFSVFFGFFRFFSVFCGIFRFFSVFLWYFFGFFGLNFDKKFQSFKNHVNNEVLGGQELPNNILNAYKALKMSCKSYFNQQEPNNENPLNQSKLAKMEKPKKTEKKPKKTKKNRKKPVPNLKFAVAFGFFWVATPPPPPPPPQNTVPSL